MSSQSPAAVSHLSSASERQAGSAPAAHTGASFSQAITVVSDDSSDETSSEDSEDVDGQDDEQGSAAQSNSSTEDFQIITGASFGLRGLDSLLMHRPAAPQVPAIVVPTVLAQQQGPYHLVSPSLPSSHSNICL